MKKRLGFFLLMIFLLVGLSFCSKEEPIPGDQILGLAFFLTTDDVNCITCVCARSGGHIIDNVGESDEFDAVGLCWSTTPNPTTADNKTIVDGVYGIDPDPKHFHSTLTGLKPGTTYYVRAYATKSSGTTYGNEVSFTTTASTAPVSDIDGNIYKTIQIGTQTWMAENLKTTRYNDGSQILFFTGGPAGYTDWFNEGDGNYRGAYCWYDNDASTYKDTFGAIYNWFAVGTDKLCPAGWHVPTNSEWTTAIRSLGGSVLPFNETTQNGMIYCYDIYESGFAPVTHGELCGWGFLKSDFWWSATPRPTELRVPYAYLMSFHIYGYEPQSYGYSVRCLKN